MMTNNVFNILIADDNNKTVDAYVKAIEKLGHNAIDCYSLSQARAKILKGQEKIDIAFLDNHFKGEGYGVDWIEAFKTQRPDIQLVLTTKYPLKPELVKQVIDLQVGFSSKDVADPVRLEMEIAKQVNGRIQTLNGMARTLDLIRNTDSERSEGLFRLFGAFRKKSQTKLVIKKITKARHRVIYPDWEKVLTVQSNTQVKLNHKLEIVRSEGIVAATEMGLGLNLKESTEFLGSKIGVEILSQIESKYSVDKKKVLKGSWSMDTLMFISNDEYDLGMRRREYYRGISNDIYRVSLDVNCSKCECGMKAMVNVLVPREIVEVSCAYDKYGAIMEDDGRRAYGIYA